MLMFAGVASEGAATALASGAVGTATAAGHRRILVVDDDEPTRTLLREVLTMEGYVVEEAPDGPSAVARVGATPPDLVLLDVMMPGQDGLDVLAVLRQTTDVPVILLTAKDDEDDRVVGLRLGADDYVGKPFSPDEVAARIETVLRRAGPSRHPAVLEFDGLRIDVASRQVTVGDEVVEMPAREFELLVFLASAPRHAFSRDELLEAVWGSSADRRQPTTVTEHVRRIRQRIEEDPDRPRWLHTVRGVGYRFDS
jgi:DNA-binding response OmpR family regulator